LLVQTAGAQHEAGETKGAGSEITADADFPFQHPLKVLVLGLFENDHLVTPDLFLHQVEHFHPVGPEGDRDHTHGFRAFLFYFYYTLGFATDY
jgi:hypothetical protein